MKSRSRTLFAIFAAVLMLAAAAALAACASPTGPARATLIYDTAGGSPISPLTTNVGSKIYPPADPERDGYEFGGWTLDGQPFEFDKMPDRDITLKAVWKGIFTLSFDTGSGGTSIDAKNIVEGGEITMPEPPTRDGYKFNGWTLDGQPFEADVMPGKNITVKAEWKVAYKITFVTGTDGYTVAPIVEEPGAAIRPPEVERKNYYVKNWLLDGVPYKFGKMPDHDITLVAEWIKLTNLPAMFVELSDSNGNTYPLSSVNREDYVSSKITIANTEKDFRLTDVKANFRGRGNGSWTDSGDKRGYKIKFDKKQSLFGRAANKHWVVIACANFNDVTMCRNYLAYNMANEVFDNIEYATTAHWLDLYVNGEYRGVYLLCEHVRVGTGRVDIKSEYGVEDTGYLIEYDAYASGEEGVDYFRTSGVKYGFSMHSPDPEDYAEEGVSKGDYQNQVSYIKDYVSRVYAAALSGNYNDFAALVDVDSFVDMYILLELFKNVDAGYSSFYLYKKPGGKLYAGPPWDFDATCNFDASYDRGDRSPTGLYVADAVQTGSPICASELLISLYNTPAFRGAVKARWKVLSPKIVAFISARLNNEVFEANKAAMGKNFARWTGRSQQDAETKWLNDVRTLKQWLVDRITWLNSTW